MSDLTFSSFAEIPLKKPHFASCKMAEFFEMSPLSRAKKHPNFQVTFCLHFDTTDVNSCEL